MTRHYTHTGEEAARSAIALLPGLEESVEPVEPVEPVGGRTVGRPDGWTEERRKRLLAKVRRMPAVKVKRAVLRFLAGMRVKAG